MINKEALLKDITGKDIKAGDLVGYTYGTHASMYLGIPIYMTDHTVRVYRMRGGYRTDFEENVTHRMTASSNKTDMMIKLDHKFQPSSVQELYKESLKIVHDKYGSELRPD